MIKRFILACAIAMGLTAAAQAQIPIVATPDTTVFQSGKPFSDYLKKVRRQIDLARMVTFAVTCPTCGARSLGVTIPEARVIIFFNRFFAARVHSANMAAGLEAPIRLYIYADADGEAVVHYKKPSVIFGAYATIERDPFGNVIESDLHVVGRQLDEAVENILTKAQR